MELALVSSHKINLTGNESVFEQRNKGVYVYVYVCVRERVRNWGSEL